MSFAGDVKNELCRAHLNRRCCALAEAYGVLLYCNTFSNREIRVVTESDAFVRRLPLLFKKAFHISVEPPAEGEGKRTFIIDDPDMLRTISDATDEEQEAMEFRQFLQEAAARSVGVVLNAVKTGSL